MNRRHFLLALLLLFAASGLVKIVVPDVQAQLVRLFQKGTATQGNCVSWFGNGVLQDAGAPCGGSGSVPGGIAGNVQYNGGGTFSGLANGSATQVLHGGSSPAMGAVNLGTDVTSTLPVANGGTGVTTAQGNGAKVQLSTGTTTTNDCVKFDANGNTVDAGAGCGSSGGSLTVGDGTHSVTGTTNLTFGSGFTTNNGTVNATVNMTATDNTKTASYSVVAGDMANALTLAATTGSPALTLPTASSTIFAPGMTLTISVPKITSGVVWTVTNSTGLTMRGLSSTTLYPGASGTFVANADGSTLDFFPGAQTAAAGTSTTGTLGAVIPDGSSITISGGVISAAASGTGCLVSGGAGAVFNNGSSACITNTDMTFAAGTLSLGTNTSELGAVKTFGNTSGDVTVKPQAVAGTATALTYPNTSGTFAISAGVQAPLTVSATTGAISTGGLNSVSGALKGNGSGTITQAACADLSNGAAGCSAGTATTSTAGIAKLHNVPVSAGWIATVNPNNVVIAVINQASTISAIIGAVETATGGTATVSVSKAASGTACSGGTVLHSGSFNANGTAATNQTLTVTTSTLAAGDRLCLQTTGTTTWTGGTGIGTITVFLAPS